LHCDVALSATDEGVQATETEEIADDEEEVWLPLEPPPQPIAASSMPKIKIKIEIKTKREVRRTGCVAIPKRFCEMLMRAQDLCCPAL
jgi:hypothetical protein